jgi:transcriptional regulator with XRE-family HTH domain
MSQATRKRFRIREILDRRGISADELSKRVGVSSTYVYRIVGNRAPNVSVNVLDELASALDVPVWALFADAPSYDGIDTEPIQHEFHELTPS